MTKTEQIRLRVTSEKLEEIDGLVDALPEIDRSGFIRLAIDHYIQTGGFHGTNVPQNVSRESGS